ncbi:MAG: tetratricopeptide repeat protein, partial [Acidobacteria bacterium]|nr:tetratricopeptide repeat protein [Acidobacteriota bacterium]
MAFFFQSQTVTDEITQHAQAAREAQRRDDFPAAVREYEAVVRLLPQNAEMLSNLGMALYFNHDLTRAVVVLRKAASLNANLVAPHLFSGLAWYRLSQPDKAVPELQKAVELSPSDVIAHTWLGYAYVAQSRYSLALNEFKAACKLDPKNIDVWYALGKAHLEVGRDATVRLIAIAPDGGRIWQLSGEQLLLKGERRGALEDFKQAFARRPDVAELSDRITELGGVPPAAPQFAQTANAEEDRLYFQALEAEHEAQASFQRVVEIAPDSYRAHQIVADAFAAGEHLEEAIEEYQAVLKQKPDLPGIHEAIGTAKLKRAKVAEALSEFEAELQIQPNSAGLHTNVAQVLILMGKDDEARKHLETALGLDRPPVEVYLLLGKIDLNRRDYRTAVATLTHYVSVKKDDSTAYYLLSRAYRGMGDREGVDRALELFQRTS